MSIIPTEFIEYEKGKLGKQTLVDLYKGLLTPRMIEEKMLKQLRQGKISKWFSGIGQEAISVGATLALEPDELIFTMHRNLGVFTSRSVPLERLFAQWQGKLLGFTKGRDRSFHFGAKDYHIVGMISHLGPQLALAGGVGLAHKLRGEAKVALAFTGEGATSEGDFHEALNVAAVWQLPVIFIIENNGYGLSTPVNEQYRCAKLADKGIGYGMRSAVIDGNNILEVYKTIKKVAKELRKQPEPFLLECQTFRRRGHEEASGVKYVPKELMEYWEKRDPVVNYEHFLLQQGYLSETAIESIRKEIKKDIETGLAKAESAPSIQADAREELEDIYAAAAPKKASLQQSIETKELRFVDAIKEGLYQSMEAHNTLVLMGQDIAEYGGVFKITEGFTEAFGKDRVRNTPLCESAIIGIALGLSIAKYKAMVEMQFGDFVSCGFNQIVNNLAKVHYRWGQNADVVIRMPSGGGVGAGPYHSQSNEAWFTQVPGLKVVYPSNPIDAKGLLIASLEDPNPVLFYEHKALYRRISAAVPTNYFAVPIGKAALTRSGVEVSIITYGMGVHWAQQVVEELGVDADILDLRTLLPLDYEAIKATVQKTNKVIILHEASLIGGFGGELAAYIGEHLFEFLDAPVCRVASLDTPVPFATELESQYLPIERFKAKLISLMSY